MAPETVGGLLEHAAAKWPDAPGLTVPDGRVWTFGELRADATRVAHALLGIAEPGERVAVWSPNCAEWYLLQLGAGLAGLTLVPVNPAYLRAELSDVLSRSRCAAIFLASEFRGVDCGQVIDEVRDDLPELRELVHLRDWSEFVDTARPRELPVVDPAAPAQIQFTSGTTGRPKGAVLPHSAIAENGRAAAHRWAVRTDDVWLNAMPMFHVAGSVINALGALAAGATQLLCRFEPAAIAPLIKERRVSVACLGGTMWTMLLDHPADYSTIRAAVAGGQHIPAELVHRVEAATGGRMSILFGMTELCGTVTAAALDDDDETRSQTCGTPLPGVQIRIVDNEIQVRGWLTMSGYFDDPDATAATLVDGGWLRTGDLGSVDDRGRLRVTGRIKEMIIRGGENISPVEIEMRLREHPAVADAAVVGLPDPLYGETVAAAVVPRGGSTLPSGAELAAWCRVALAPYKAPTTWATLSALPTTPAGKVQKFLVRDALAAAKVAELGRTEGAAPVSN